MRALKLAFESHIGQKIPSDHSVIPWLVEYAAVLLSRGQVSSDGKTPYERLKGKPANLPGLQFGERLLWRTNVPARDRKNRMDTPTKKGVYLGQRTVSGEYLVGSAEGVFRPGLFTVCRWSQGGRANLSLVQRLQWKHNEKHEIGEEALLDIYAREPSLQPVWGNLSPQL